MYRSHAPMCCLLTSFVVAGTAAGETHMLGSLPRKPGKAAFTLTVEIDSVAGDGYQPIYLKFKPRGKTFGRDHRVGVRVSPRNQFISSLDMAYDRRFTLSQGKTQHHQTIYVPYYYAWDTLIVTLLEDGRKVDTGQQHFSVGSLRTRDANQQTTVGVILPRDGNKQDAAWKKCPDARTLTTVLGDGPLPEDDDVKRLSHKESLDYLQSVQPAWVQFRPIAEAQLHSTWLGYSQIDVMIAARPVLARIESEQPEAFAAVRTWINAGGNLWAYGSDEDDQAFLASCHCKPISASKVAPAKRVRGVLDLGDFNDTSELNYEYYRGVLKMSQNYATRQMRKEMSTREEIFRRLEKAEHPFATLTAPASLAKKIRTTKHGLGTVTLIAEDDPFPGSFQLWHAVARLHDPKQIRWLPRNGVKPPQGNANYWSWLIPSVGKPPVKSFILLNTLFIIVIGPLAYFFFRRRERLYLLFFFAPVFATAVTLSLFGYAVMADGTATRMRTRQLTWIDSKHDVTSTQSRQTYYAVFGSRKGLELADDTAVFPVSHSAAVQRYRYHQSSREPPAILTSTPSVQNFSGAFLPARNQVQYLTISPDRIDGRLTFELDSDPPSVTNDFQLGIRELLVCDRNGRRWTCSGIAAGSTTTLEAAPPSMIEEFIDERGIPDPTEIPMLSANRNTTIIGDQSLLEIKLLQWANRLPSGRFVAEAELIDGEIGIKDAIIRDSVHLIMGELP